MRHREARATALLLTSVLSMATAMMVDHVSSKLSVHRQTENFVKGLEHKVLKGDNTTEKGLTSVDLNLLPDEEITGDIVDGLDQEFSVMDGDLGEADLKEEEKPAVSTQPNRDDRQISLMYQGVYIPDSRFNAFIDGVMVNMVSEMHRKRMDPLYFRVYDRGIVEHVPTSPRRGREDLLTGGDGQVTSRRNGRQNPASAIGGGVIRGLTNVRRFGNAEVQVAGNTTLVRSHYVFGPLNIELLFETRRGVKAINSTLSAIAGHALTEIGENSSRLMEFFIDSPAEYDIQLIGAKSQRIRRLSRSANLRLFKRTGRLELRLKQCLVRSHRKPIPDAAQRQGTREGGQSAKGSTKKGNSTTVADENRQNEPDVGRMS